MNAKGKLNALLEASEAELESAEAALADVADEEGTFAKAEGAELDGDFDELDDAITASDAAEDDEDDDEDDDLDGAVDEDDEGEEAFAKADDELTPVDATDLVQGLLDTLTTLNARVERMEAHNRAMAKAMQAQLRGQRVLAKAQGAALGMPLKPKAARVPTKAPAQPDPTQADPDAIMAKAVEAIAEGTITSQDVSVFNAYVQDYGLPVALELMPNFRTFATGG